MKAEKYLEFLNKKYFKLHKNYEELFWISYMGDHSVNKRKDKALAERDKFKTDPKHLTTLKQFLNEKGKGINKDIKERIKGWIKFFECYGTPKEVKKLKEKIDQLETSIHKKLAKGKEGYIDPLTKKFVEASENKMSTIMVTHDDEKVRKACFEAREKLAVRNLKEYVELIKLRNEYARRVGYKDFYAYKADKEEGMEKEEIFSIFDKIYQRTKYAHKNIRDLEKKMPGLRKPWNFSYKIAGSFAQEEDPYFQFEDALVRWGKSFAQLGIDFKGGKLGLDLLDRKGKYSNGFCHWPEMVRFENGKKVTGTSNFTCNVVPGQVGSGSGGHNTLFHEGGHSAHFLNSTEKDVWANQEYAPTSTAWAETQSMFLDTMFSSIEWRDRYAEDKNGNPYPFDLFKRQVEKLHIIRPRSLNGIMSVASFENAIYKEKNLTIEKVKEIARKNFKKYHDYSEDSLRLLLVPHIYSWESSASYHGYGLATLALNQWRKYFYDKYGFIVDNPKVGKEMEKVWSFAGSKTFKEAVILATGQKLGAEAYLENITASKEKIISRAKDRIKRLKNVKMHSGPIKLNAKIRLFHGKKEIATSNKSFEHMAATYKKWLKTL